MTEVLLHRKFTLIDNTSAHTGISPAPACGQDLRQQQKVMDILKQIPGGAELANLLGLNAPSHQPPADNREATRLTNMYALGGASMFPELPERVARYNSLCEADKNALRRLIYQTGKKAA